MMITSHHGARKGTDMDSGSIGSTDNVIDGGTTFIGDGGSAFIGSTDNVIGDGGTLI